VQGPGGASLTPHRHRRPLVLGLVGLALAVLVVDQLTKVWAERTLAVGERTPLLGDLLGLTLLHNPGAALSLATGMTWVFTVAAVVVSFVVLRVAHRLGSVGWSVALGLLLGGALGNLVDRLFRSPGPGRGHVVDFIAYGDLFVGNVADIAIVVAAGLIVLLSLRGIGIDGSRGEHDRAGDEASAEAEPVGETRTPRADGQTGGA
jgi:signal peptidase II